MVRSMCSPLSLVSYLIAALVIVPYYLSADQANPLNLANLNGRMISLLVYFMVFHAGICTLLIWKFCKERPLWIALFSLLLCMVASATVNVEMAMKGSAVSAYYLFILFSDSYQKAGHSDKKWFIFYAVGMCLYFVNMHGAAATLAWGSILFLLLQRRWVLSLAALSLVGFILALFPQKLQDIGNNLTGRRTFYNPTVRIYQPDGGSGKWWWYKTFPMKEELPFWFRR